MKLHALRNVAEVRGDADPHALRLEAEADGIYGVVRDREALHLDIADGERRAGLKGLDARRPLLAPSDTGLGEPREPEHRAHVAIPAQHRQTGNVIRMLVRDQNRVDAAELFLRGRQPVTQLQHADAGVDQDTRALGS